VEDLIAAMNDVKIDAATQKIILGVFGPMKPQVIGQ
jgi:hemoglobin